MTTQLEIKLKECIDILSNHQKIWFRTNNKKKVDALTNLNLLFIGLLTALTYDNNLKLTYVFNKYNPKYKNSIKQLFDTDNEADKNVIKENYLFIYNNINNMIEM